jgi:hypothetical protein
VTAILYREELRAMMRVRFAWLGAGVVLLALGGVAAAATQDAWVDGYGIIAYFLVPLAFVPLAVRRQDLDTFEERLVGLLVSREAALD